MIHKRIRLALILIATIITPFTLLAGTLDNAPFIITLPSADWKLSDSTSQKINQDILLVATFVNNRSDLESHVCTTRCQPVPFNPFLPSTLDKLCADVNRDMLVKSAYKKISETDTTFVGIKAKALAYEWTQDGGAYYEQGVVFIVGNTGWIITFSGPAAQKEALKQMITFYRPKKADRGDISIVEKALFGHWVSESGKDHYYFSAGKLIATVGKSRNESTFVVSESNESEDWLKIDFIGKPGMGLTKLLTYTKDRNALFEKNVSITYKGTEDTFGAFLHPTKWNYVDSKAQP